MGASNLSLGLACYATEKSPTHPNHSTCNLAINGTKNNSLYMRYWSDMTLNYWIMVEGYPNLKKEVSGLNPGYEISSLPDGNLSSGQLPLVLWHWHVGLLSQKNKIKK